MIRLLSRALVSAGVAFAFTTAAVTAGPLEVKLALSVDVLSGDHEISLARRDNLHWVPLPLGELTLRRGPDALRIEGMPPLSSTYGTGDFQNANSVRLSILNVTYRRDLGHGWFAGAGQTVYNQATIDVPNTFRAQAQYSRVTGVRWEIGNTARVGRESLETSASVNPAMHGLAHTQLGGYSICRISGPISLPSPCFGVGGVTIDDSESAAQVDLAARIAHRFSKRGELLYGIRYLNYSARLDRVPGNIADRNVGFAPTVGVRVRL